MPRKSRYSAARIPTALQALLIACAALTAAGCEDYLDRRDTFSRVAGEANAFNKATQTINRWPKHANRDSWRSDGERARTAVERYRTGTVVTPPPVGSSATQNAPPAAAPAAGAAAAPATTSK